MDLSWSEILVVAIVALIVIGPKDLPGMFRELGRFTAKVRAMGREFSRAMEAAAKESGVKDVAEDLKKATSAKAMGLDAVKSAADKFEKWDPLKNAAKPAAATAAKSSSAKPEPASGDAAKKAAEPAKEAAKPAAPGPATAALYEKQAARKAVLEEASAKLRAISTPGSAEAPAEAPKKPGRRRKKADTPDGESA